VTAFTPDTVIERRELLHGLPWLITPVRVVNDSGDLLATYLTDGTRLHFPEHPFGPHPWSGHTHWRKTDVLMLHRPGDAHSVWGFYEHGTFTGWYVNFQAPMRRRLNGIDTLDHGVDIWLPNGGPDWEWKDRDHVAEYVRAGRLTEEEAVAVWAEAEKVAAALDRGERWWRDWDGWRPTLPGGAAADGGATR
jgi:hypothetical protein